MVEIRVDGFVVGYVEEWVYDLLYPVLESAYQAEGRAHKLEESVIEAGEGPSMRDIQDFVRKCMRDIQEFVRK